MLLIILWLQKLTRNVFEATHNIDRSRSPGGDSFCRSHQALTHLSGTALIAAVLHCDMLPRKIFRHVNGAVHQCGAAVPRVNRRSNKLIRNCDIDDLDVFKRVFSIIVNSSQNSCEGLSASCTRPKSVLNLFSLIALPVKPDIDIVRNNALDRANNEQLDYHR